MRDAGRSRPSGASSCKDRVRAAARATWPGSRRRSSSRATPKPTPRADILGGGKSSRLYKKLVYEKQIAQDVTAYQQSLALGSVFQIVATVRPGKTAAGGRSGDRRRAEALPRGGSGRSAKSSARATRSRRACSSGLEVLGGFGGVADTLNMFNHYVGDPGYLPKYLDEHRKRDAGERQGIRRSSTCKPTARVVVHGVPGKPDLGAPVPTPPAPKVAPGTGAEAVNADEPWRKDQPARRLRRSRVSCRRPRSFTLPNGLTVIHQKRPGMPVVGGQAGRSRPAATRIPSGGPGWRASRPRCSTRARPAATRSQIADDVAQIGASLDGDVVEGLDHVERRIARGSNFTARARSARGRRAASELSAGRSRSRSARAGWRSLVAQRQDPAHGRRRRGAWRRCTAARIRTGTSSSARTSPPRPRRATTSSAFWKQHFVPAQRRARGRRVRSTAAELRPLVEKAFGGWPARRGARRSSRAPSDDRRARRAGRSSRARRRRSSRRDDRPPRVRRRITRRSAS